MADAETPDRAGTVPGSPLWGPGYSRRAALHRAPRGTGGTGFPELSPKVTSTSYPNTTRPGSSSPQRKNSGDSFSSFS